ncbi:MAG: hypothetical protein ACYSUB_13645 [Planctomycetota bacterium]|jgi:hypothetical protein
MAATTTGTVWAIDLGNNSLKALHLSTERGVIEVIGFDNIQHGRILSGSNVGAAERDELVALTLRKFVSRHDLSMDVCKQARSEHGRYYCFCAQSE